MVKFCSCQNIFIRMERNEIPSPSSSSCVKFSFRPLEGYSKIFHPKTLQFKARAVMVSFRGTISRRWAKGGRNLKWCISKVVKLRRQAKRPVGKSRFFVWRFPGRGGFNLELVISSSFIFFFLIYFLVIELNILFLSFEIKLVCLYSTQKLYEKSSSKDSGPSSIRSSSP